jgi:hypothetical protein
MPRLRGGEAYVRTGDWQCRAVIRNKDSAVQLLRLIDPRSGRDDRALLVGVSRVLTY